MAGADLLLTTVELDASPYSETADPTVDPAPEPMLPLHQRVLSQHPLRSLAMEVVAPLVDRPALDRLMATAALSTDGVDQMPITAQTVKLRMGIPILPRLSRARAPNCLPRQ